MNTKINASEKKSVKGGPVTKGPSGETVKSAKSNDGFLSVGKNGKNGDFTAGA